MSHGCGNTQYCTSRESAKVSRERKTFAAIALYACPLSLVLSNATSWYGRLEERKLTGIMLKLCVLVLASVSCASSTGVSDANAYVDSILREKMPLLVRGSPQLATIGDFTFKVSKDRIINHGLEVNMTRGEIHGLDNALQRSGDCLAPEVYEGQTLINCYLTVQGLNVTFTALAKEDTLATVWTTTWVNVAVRNTTAHFEASAPQGRDGTLRTFIIDHIRLHVTYDSNLSFHERRSRKFKEEIHTRVEYELMQIFQFDYKDLLSRAVESVTFPRL